MLDKSHLNFYIIGRISTFIIKHNTEMKYEYGAISDDEIVSRLFCNYKLEPGNWYEFKDVKMSEVKVYWESMRIRSFIKIIKSEYKQINMTPQKHDSIIKLTLVMFQFGLNRIIDFCQGIKQFNIPEFRSDMFNSLHFSCSAERRPKLT